MDGTHNKWIACLHPKNDVINPKVKALKAAPIVFMDPNHESSSLVRGPVFNGVEFDIRIGVDGDIQPENTILI